MSKNRMPSQDHEEIDRDQPEVYAGANAYYRGVDIDSCPHAKSNGNRSVWMTGWLDARTRNRLSHAFAAYGIVWMLSVCFSSSVLGQIELSYTIQKTMVGAVNPVLLDGGRILMDEDSVPALSRDAVIKVASTERVRLRASKAFKAYSDLIPLGESTDAVSKVITSKYLLAGEGSFLVDAMSVSWDRTIDVVIGSDPKPPTPPVPPTPPDPPIPPGPVTSFRVILVKESGSTLTAEQTAIAGSKVVRDYLTSRTTPEGGLAGWREYDPQQNVTNERVAMKALWAATKSSITTVPCLVVERNGKAEILSYPKNVADAIKTLKEFGGN